MKAGSIHRRRLLLWMVMVLAVPVCFYAGFEYAAYRIVQHHHLPSASRNTIKHTYTAAVLADILLQAGVEVQKADKVIHRLGVLNEHMETYSKFYHPDSAQELRKDLRNNYVGMVIATWRREQGSGEPLSVLVADIYKNFPLGMPELESHPVPEGRASRVRDAEAWLNSHKQDIRQSTVNSLRMRDENL